MSATTKRTTDVHENGSSLSISEHRWRPRLFSPITTFFFVMAIICLGLFALSLMFGEMEIQRKYEFINLIMGNTAQFLSAGILALIIAAINEAISRLRIPPPTWRVKQELTRALCDLGLLEKNDTTYWKGAYWVAPIGKWNSKSKSFELLFDIRNVNATQEKFDQLEESIAGFARSQDVSIEHWKIKNNRNGFKLTLWYSSNPFEKPLSNITPDW